MIQPPRERHALVIGAGLAGAAVCFALARRGWRLTLMDAASGPAQGASALPVGMLSPHVTRAPTPLS
ncbi:MAG: FAD-dependent oxidoreductase, partial [Hydrogenophaga sp.]|nr:FAD-dependent oxidoreductase [Hydrogenophaga sp.]